MPLQFGNKGGAQTSNRLAGSELSFQRANLHTCQTPLAR